MYLPQHFNESRPEILLKVMRENGFATVVTVLDNVPFASHVPVLVEGESVAAGLRIRGHVARANHQWRQLEGDRPPLMIFHGPHCYVSPSWYEEVPNVPTWNYVTVHAYGRVRLLDPPELRALLRSLVETHERSSDRPWRFDSLPQDFVEELLAEIVGFEIDVERLEGKLKLSQNRLPGDQVRVRERLAASSDPAARQVAEWMSLLRR
jgi:transcriptional regulator